MNRRDRLFVAAVGAVALLALCWLAVLFLPSHDSGTLDQRVDAVAATVRCPVCPEPVSLNQQSNAEAQTMRQFIRRELQRGLSEEQVRQELARAYGPSILLAPPRQGFDLLAWLVPLVVLCGCAVAVIVAVRRWSAAGDTAAVAVAPDRASHPELQRYEQALERELAQWE